MKRSSLWNLFFGAMMAVVLTVTGCVDDNEDKGAPYLEVTPTTLAFDEEGQPADEWNGVFTVQTNRPWRATVRAMRPLPFRCLHRIRDVRPK